MARDRSTTRLVWLRRLLLLAVVLSVGALVGLYLFGRAGRESRPAPTPEEELGVGGEVVTLGEGFEYVHYDQGREVFVIRAEQTSEDRQELVRLEGVELKVTDEAGRVYNIRSERATYQRKRQEAQLEGNVVVRGGDGFTLEADALDFGNRGRLLTSVGAVSVTYGERYEGRADRLRIHFPQDLFLLTGNVELSSLPGAPVPVRLTSERLFFERRYDVVRIDGGVEVLYGPSRLAAEEIHLALNERLTRLRFLRARTDVEGLWVGDASPGTAGGEEAVPEEEFMGPPAPTRTTISALGMIAVRRPTGGFEDIQLEGTPQEPAMLGTATATGAEYRLTAGYMTSKLNERGSQRVRAFGNLELLETDPGARGEPLRRLEGERGWAAISAEGTVHTAQVTGKVTYRDARITARGAQATIDLAAGKGEFLGAVDGGEGEVILTADQGELRAPKVAYTEESSILHAEGGATTRMADDVSPFGAALGDEGSGPTRVESEEAFFRDRPRSFLFRGDVRAWRGPNLLLAEWVRGDQDHDQIAAGGGVRTVWVPQEVPPVEASEAEDGSPPLDLEGQPLEVNARELTYERGSGLLLYQKEVVATQAGRELACDRLEVELDERSRAERLVGTGNVTLDDPDSANEITAERAVYQPAARQVEFTGSPVVVRDGQGGEVKAPRLVYDLAEGRVRAAAAETQPAPEQGTPEGGEEGP